MQKVAAIWRMPQLDGERASSHNEADESCCTEIANRLYAIETELREVAKTHFKNAFTYNIYHRAAVKIY